MRLHGWLSGKEASCNEGDTGDAGSVPGSGRPLEEGNSNPLQYSCLKNPMDEEPGGLQFTVTKSGTQLK